jgi:hypothetical protein
MMTSRHRLLVTLASGLGVLALAGGIVVSTASEADGLMPEVTVHPYNGPVTTEQHEERKKSVELRGDDPIAAAAHYTDRIDRAHAAADEELAPDPEPVAPTSSTPNYSSGTSVWDRLAECESNGNWAINTGNGYYGGLQFSLSTWRSVGGSGYPHEASREEQIHRAEILRDINGGYGAWPSCSAQLGL